MLEKFEPQLIYTNRRAKEEGLWQEDDDFFDEPRPEYRNGMVPLNFDFQFKSGEHFAAADREGGVKMEITQDGSTIIDFNEYVEALGYEFLTPELIRTRGLIDLTWSSGKWKTILPRKEPERTGYISIGDMQTPEDIFRVLHELGHARLITRPGEIYETLNSNFSDKQRYNIMLSVLERSANAGMVHLARQVREKYSINLFDITDGFSKLKKSIDAQLAGYKYGAEYSETFGDKSAWKQLWDIWVLQSKGDPKIKDFYSHFFNRKSGAATEDDLPQESLREISNKLKFSDIAI